MQWSYKPKKFGSKSQLCIHCKLYWFPICYTEFKHVEKQRLKNWKKIVHSNLGCSWGHSINLIFQEMQINFWSIVSLSLPIRPTVWPCQVFREYWSNSSGNAKKCVPCTNCHFPLWMLPFNFLGARIDSLKIKSIFIRLSRQTSCFTFRCLEKSHQHNLIFEL